jgi:hypothetical protein
MWHEALKQMSNASSAGDTSTSIVTTSNKRDRRSLLEYAVKLDASCSAEVIQPPTRKKGMLDIFHGIFPLEFQVVQPYIQ